MLKIIKISIIAIVLITTTFAQADLSSGPKYTVVKSALIPGWGEHSLGSPKRGFLFNGIEAGLWLVVGIASSTANAYEDDLFKFAADYGQITDPQSKGDIFLDRVSKYDNMDEYNDQMLRNRQWDRIYRAEDGNYWDWESDEKRDEYFDIKTERYLWRQRVTYTFGAITLNHLVSAMDALYLKRQSIAVSIHPEILNGGSGIRLSMTF